MKNYQFTAFISLPDEFDFTDGINEAWIEPVVKCDYGPYGSISKWTDEMHVEWMDCFPVDKEFNYVASR